MAWTYAELKNADAALGIADPAAAAAALNAQTVTVMVDIPTANARSVLLLSGEWFKVKQLAKMATSGSSPPSSLDQAIAAADICVDTLTLTDVLHTGNEVEWAAMQPMIGALAASGVVSTASVTKWSAMRTQVLPLWQPPIESGHIQTARVQP